MNQTSSDGGTSALAALQGRLKESLKTCKIAKLFVLEVFLIKSLKQHRSAVAANDQSEIDSALRAIQREHAFLTSNQIGLAESDACPPMVKLAKLAMK